MAKKSGAPTIIVRNVPDDVMNAACTAIREKVERCLECMKGEQDSAQGPENFWCHYVREAKLAHQLLMGAWVEPRMRTQRGS